jgi:DNA modification methylase
MAALPAESVDAVVTDPPYGLEFMGREWDAPWKSGAVVRDPATERGGFQDGNGGNPYSRSRIEYGRGNRGESVAFQAWCEVWTREALRVLKPGGHLLAFGGTRTYHRLTCAIEDAGFEIRDCLAWLYGSGFPKSLDVSKAIDKAAGATREVVGVRDLARRNRVENLEARRDGLGSMCGKGAVRTPEEAAAVTAPATPEAQAWAGWGTALKPSHEPVVVARKPLRERTVAAQVLATGTGGLNVDGCRIGTEDDLNGGRYSDAKRGDDGHAYGAGINRRSVDDYTQPAGRWPANVALDGQWEPILRPRDTLESDGWNLLADWCRAHDADVPRVRGQFRRAAQPGEAPEVLRPPVSAPLDERAPAGGGAPDVRASALGGVAGEDDRCEEGAGEAWAGEPELEGALRLAGIRDDLAAGREGDPGAPAGNGGPPRPAVDQGRGRPSPQRREVGQPDRELGTPHEAHAQDDPRGGAPRTEGAPRRGGTAPRRAVEVLMRDVPRVWLGLFEFTGDVAFIGAARMLDQAVGERPSNSGTPFNRQDVGYHGGCDPTVAPGYYGDNGGPSRFFYTAKASTSERDGATHPTVKPLDLMRWLVRLATPPGGVVLEPFAGSGTTLLAAKAEGFRCIGIEREAEYAAMAAERYRRRWVPAEAEWKTDDDDDQLSLLGGAA